jgi:hypothetical protein
MSNSFKNTRKTTVQLTSLLDLLFVMIFVSLLQQKKIDPVPVKAKPVKTVVKKTKTPPVKKQVLFSLSAQFNFYGTANNKALPAGSYKMQGRYNDKTGELQLGGISWINQPANYDMAALSGKVNSSKDKFSGRVELGGCKQFTLKKIKAGGKTPISGQWMGTYDCSQGLTGLTLEIN